MSEVHRPSPTALPDGVRRESVRPMQYRDADFDEQHDSTTMYYDAFWHGSSIVLIGPPLNNLQQALEDLQVTAEPSKVRCSYRQRSLTLHQQLWVQAPPDTHALRLDSGLGEIVVPVTPAAPGELEGRRVLCTMSKDNDLTWIEDWVRFHRDLHGADAVLVYDNASSAYTADVLLERLRGLEGIAAAVVVDWPFKYGPQGYQRLGFWDSAYSQAAALEHARWSLLSGARSVMNGDVDELVHSPRGDSVFEAVEASRFGVLRYNGYWMPTTDRTALAVDDLPRHRDFEHYVRPVMNWRKRPPRRGFSAPKWAVVPQRCPDTAQWQVHRIHGWPAAAVVTRRFAYRHYRRLSTGWKYDRADVQPFDPAVHVHDVGIARDYGRVRWST